MTTSALQPAEAFMGHGRLWYLTGGPLKGLPLVFLHGIGGGSGDWSENLGYFAERGYRVFAPDLPSHGHSGPLPRDWDPHRGGETVLNMLDAWGLEKAILLGNSVGGLLALQAALAAQERVEALVLTAPAGLGRDINPALRVLTTPFLGRALWRPWPITGRIVLRNHFADDSRVTPSLVQAWLARHHDPFQRQEFLRLLRKGANIWGLHSDLVLTNRLEDLRMPVLLVWGREDQVLPARHAKILMRKLPQTRLLYLSPCGHWPQMEQAEKFNPAVERFLGETVGTT